MSDICVVFPGQGAQFVGMGRELIESNLSSTKELFEQASDILGWNLEKVCLEGPEEELVQTRVSQPALLVVSYALYRVLQEEMSDSHKIVACAGLSLGEYTALLAAQSITFSQAVELVKKRGLFMQESSENNPGVMASVIGLEETMLDQIINQVGDENLGPCVMANFNSPGQIVISGTKEAVEEVVNKSKEAGAKRAMFLSVGGAFHSPLMRQAVLKFEQEVNQMSFKDPQMRFYSNVTASLETAHQDIKQLLCSQIESPVRWTNLVRNIIDDSPEVCFLEVGPGKVLTGLLRRIDKSKKGISIQTKQDILSALSALE